MKWSEYIAKREIILERFEEGKISEERMDVLLKRLDNLKLIVGIEPDEVDVKFENLVQNGIRHGHSKKYATKMAMECWTDPAGGTHYGNESDPAAMYI